MAKSPAWQRKAGQDPTGGFVIVQGPGVRQKAGDEPQAACSEPEDQEGRRPEEKLLRPDGRNARSDEGRKRKADT